ncbi:MAG TPA: hypothetical protein VK607_25935, partial [Kofleriaceae bacterium]|nr:hypothetical protein [Kofleriaceae bacterium]
LTELARELLDAPHGYLLPFDLLVRALGGKSTRSYQDPTGGLGYGPIDRPDGLEIPRTLAPVAQRRLGPLVARMRGDHTFGGAG